MCCIAIRMQRHCYSMESVRVLCHAMVSLAKKLDMFRSEAASFLCCYLICADSTVLLQGLESDDDDKKPATGKAEDAKQLLSMVFTTREMMTMIANFRVPR